LDFDNLPNYSPFRSQTGGVLQNRFQRLVADVKKRVKEQHPLEVKQEIDGGASLTLVDVREGDEWKRSRVGLTNVVHLSKVLDAST
jgi:hypothetical protein